MLANDVRIALVKAGKLAGFRGRSLRRFLKATADGLVEHRRELGCTRRTIDEDAEYLAEFVVKHGRQA